MLGKPFKRLPLSFCKTQFRDHVSAGGEQLSLDSGDSGCARKSERGNVFFTLFGAVALVGVLGAGIMSTMRGPLSTMVQVNLREQAKSEMNVNLRLILASSIDDDTDSLTEPLVPVTASCDAGSTTGQGCIPSSVGASLNDPWGSAYRYCAWNVGQDTGADGKWLVGEVSINNIAVALISPGPNKTYDNDCSAAPTYVTATPLDDDIIIRMTYVDAIAGSNGLWLPDDTDALDPLATIDRSIDLTGPVSAGTLPSAQLRLGAASMLLPDETALATCSAANDGLIRIDTSGSNYAIEVCQNGTGWIPAGGVWLPGSDDDIYYDATTPQVGIGTATPDDTLDVVGTAEITSNLTVGGNILATTANSYLDLGGSRIAEVGGADIVLTPNGGSVGIGVASPGAPLEVAGNSNVALFGSGQTGDINFYVGSAVSADNAGVFRFDETNDRIVLYVAGDSASTPFVIEDGGNVGIRNDDPSQELDVTGDVQVSGTYMISGTQMLGTDGVATNVLLGPVASPSPGVTANYMNLGDAIHADLTNKYVGIGFADTYDVSSFDDALEVNGNIDASGLKISGTSSADILIASGTNVYTPQAMSGDATLSTGGVIDLEDSAVEESEIADNAVTNAKLADNAVDIDEIAATASGGGLCLKSDGTTGLQFAVCGGGSGSSGDQNLDEVLAVGNDAGGRRIQNLNTPNSANDAATKGYVDGEIAGAILDGVRKLADADGNTQVQVEESPNEDTIRFDTAGTERMVIEPDGDIAFDTDTLFVDEDTNRVGIGTASPSVSLNVESADEGLAIFESTDNRGFIQISDNDTNAYISAQDNIMSLGHSNYPISSNINILNSGDVGIGTTTPEATLDVAGAGSILFPRGVAGDRPSPAVNGMMRYNSDSERYEAYQNGAWQDIITSGGGGIFAVRDRDGDTSIVLDNMSDDPDLDVIRFSAQGSERMVIDAAGNLVMGAGVAASSQFQINHTAGIGGTSFLLIDPVSSAARWQIFSAGNPTTRFVMQARNSASETVVSIDPDGTTYFNGANLAFGLGTTLPQATFDVSDLQLDVGTGLCPAGYEEGDFDGEADNADCRFVTFTADSATGWVGIGTNAPEAALDVAGTDAILFPRGTSGNRPSVPVNGMMRYNTASGRYEAYQGGAWEDIITSGGGAVFAVVDRDGDTGMTVDDPGDDPDLDTIRFETQNVERMVIRADGEIVVSDGSGITFANAGVAGSVRSLGSARLAFQLGGTTSFEARPEGLMFPNGQAIIDQNANEIVAFPLAGSAVNYFNLANAPTGDAIEMSAAGDDANIDIALTPKGTGGVGIGTVSPEATLDVAGTGSILFPRGLIGNRPSGVDGMMRYNTVSGRFEAFQGGVWEDIITSGGGGVYAVQDRDGDTTISVDNLGDDPDLDTIRFETQNLERMVIEGDGDIAFDTNTLFVDEDTNRVGIGTTSPSNALQVIGTIRTGGTSPGKIIIDGSDVGSTPGEMSVFENNGELSFDTRGGFRFYLDNNNDSSSVRFGIGADGSGDNLFAVQETGRVGIGTVTPAAVLEVAGTDAVLFPRGDATNRPSVPVDGMIRYNTVSGKFEGYQGGSWSDLLTTAVTDIDWDSIVDAMTLDADTNVTMGGFDLSFNNGSALFIDGANDRVGIGTNLPSEALNIIGNFKVQHDISGDDTGVSIFTGSRSNPEIRFHVSDNATRFSIVADGETSPDNDVLRFREQSNDVLVITGTGNVGIGTTSPGDLLDIEDGSLRLSESSNSSYSQILHSNGDGSISISADAGNTLAGSEIRMLVDGTEYMRVQNDGKVGIGTTTPLEELQVDGSIALNANEGIRGNIYFDSAAGSWKFIENGFGGAMSFDSSTGTIFFATTASSGLADASVSLPNRMAIDAAGHVGIGSLSPEATLDVAGTGSILFPRGIVGNRPSGVDGMMRYNTASGRFEAFQAGVWEDIITSGGGGVYAVQDRDGDTTITVDNLSDDPDLDTIRFETQNLERMVIEGDGDIAFDTNTLFVDEDTNRVGIGTTAPVEPLSVVATTTSNSDSVLMLRDNRTTSSDVNYVVNLSRQNSDTAALFLGNDDDNSAVIAANNSVLRIGKDVSETFSEYMRINTNGNVGIGTAVTNTRLQVNETTSATDSIQTILRLQHSTASTPAAGMGTALDFLTQTQAASNWELGGVISSVATDVTADSEDFDLVFSTMAAGATADEKLRITSDGNVGIGTTSPEAVLDVAGTDAILFPRGTDGDRPSVPVNGMIRYNTTAGKFEGYQGGSWSDLLTTAVTEVDWDSIVDAMTLDADTDVSMGSFDLSFNNGSALFIDGANDRVGIGTASPAIELDVDGSIRVSNGNQVQILGTGGIINSIRSAGTSDLTFRVNGQDEVVIADGGNVGIGTTSPNGKFEVVTGETSNRMSIVFDEDADKQQSIIFSEGTPTTYTPFFSIQHDGNPSNPANLLKFRAADGDGVLDVDVMTLTQSGRVGIGTDTPSSTAPLHVRTDINAPRRIVSQNVNVGTAATGGFEMAANGVSAELTAYSSAHTGTFGSEPINVADSIVLRTFSSAPASQLIIGTGSAAPVRLFTADTTRILIDATGNVGIGATTPEAALDVAGTDAILFPRGDSTNRPSVPVNGMMRYNTVAGKFEAYQGGSWLDILTTGASSIDWDAIVDNMTLDADTDVSMGSFDLSFNNGSALFIDGTNNRVGIGTTSPIVELDVDGVINAATRFVVNNDYPRVAYFGNDDNLPSITFDGNDGFRYAQNTDRYDFIIGGSPIAQLNAARFSKVTDSATANAVENVMRLTKTTSGTPAVGIGVGMEFDVETAADNNEIGALIEAVTTDVTATSEDFDLVFKTMAAGAAADEAMRVTSDGNVGIGTSSPSAELEIAGINSSVNTSRQGILVSTDDLAGSTGNAGVYLSAPYGGGTQNSGYLRVKRGASDTYNGLEIASSGDFRILTNADHTTEDVNERFRVTSAGNVGIGTSSPAEPWHLFGSQGSDLVGLIENDGLGRAILSLDSGGTSTTEVRFGLQDVNYWSLLANGDTGFGLFDVNDSAYRWYVDADGDVGIGTVSPETTLDVAGTGSILFPRGIVGNRPSGVDGMMRYNTVSGRFEAFQAGVWEDIITSGGGGVYAVQDRDGDTTITVDNLSDDPDLDTIRFETEGVERFSINANGTIQTNANFINYGGLANSGLFFSSSDRAIFRRASGGFTSIAQFNNGSNSTAADTGAMILFETGATGATDTAFVGGALENGVNNDDAYLAFGTRLADSLTEKARISAAGNFGVGVTAPAYRLDAQAADGAKLLRVADTDSSYGGMFLSADTNGAYITNSDISSAIGEGIYLANVNNAIRFFNNSAETMRIDADGDVGIGTAAPDTQLHIDATTDSILTIEGGDTSYRGLEFQIANGTVRNYLGMDGEEDMIIGINNTIDHFIFQRGARGAATDLVTIEGTGSVGIGTSDPEAILDVAGTDAILFPRGDGTNRPSVPVNGMMRYNTVAGKFEAYQGGSWLDILTTGVSEIDWDSIEDSMTLDADTDVSMGSFDLSFNNGSALFIDGANDRVGIGTNAPAVSLDLDTADANMAYFRRSGVTRVTLEASGSNGSIGVVGSLGNEYVIGANGNNFEIWDGGYMGNGDNRFTIDASGNVGIGAASPSEKLQVDGNIRVKGTNEVSVQVFGHGGTDNSFRMGMGNNLYWDGTNWLTRTDGSSNGATGVLGRYGPGELGFYTIPSTGSSAQTIANADIDDYRRMHIDQDGNVGIGAAAASSAVLTVAGGVNIRTAVQPTSNRLRIEPAFSTTPSNGDAKTYAAFRNILAGENIGLFMDGDDSTDRISFMTDYGSTGTYTERMSIVAETGNVGIGTTSPGYALDVNGDIRIPYDNALLLNDNTNTPRAWLEMGTFSGVNSLNLRNRTGAITINTGDTATHGVHIEVGGQVGIGTAAPEAALDVAGTDAILFPRGDGTNRPSVPVNGMMRYNTVAGKFEAYQGGSWLDILTTGASNIDWNSIVDAMTLDADTDVSMGGFDLSFNNGSALFIDGANDRVGIGTNAPTHSLALGSTGNGIAYYNTADTTNYERLLVNWSSNEARMFTTSNTLAAGRPLKIGASGLAQPGSPHTYFQIQHANNSFSFHSGLNNAGNYINTAGLGSSLSAGSASFLNVNPTISQSGTANYTALLVNPTEGSVGSGDNYLARFAVGGSNRVVIDNGGNVGVGTAAPAGKLHLSVGDQDGFYVESSGSARLDFDPSAVGGAIINNVEATGLFFRQNNSTTVTFAGNGNVGIGVTTPGAALEVAGTDAILFPRGTSANRPSVPVNGMMRYNSDNNNFDVYQNGGWTTITTAGADSIDWDDIADAMMLDADTDVSMGGFDLSFNNGSALFIDGANERVGIGMAAPSSKLEVAGITRLGDISTVVPSSQGVLVYTGNSANVSKGIDLIRGTSWTSPASLFSMRMMSNGSGTYRGALGFSNSASFAETMTFDASGNVGIGTAAPDAKLEISDAASATLLLSGPVSGISLQDTSDDDDTFIRFVKPSGDTFYGFGVDSGIGDNDYFVVRSFDPSKGVSFLGPVTDIDDVRVGIGVEEAVAALEVAGTDAILFPRGDGTNRPSVPVNGMMRYNTVAGRFEAYQGGSWLDILTTGVSEIDWDSIEDSMTLDADTDVAMGSFDLSFNNGSALFIDGATDRVGIGTTSPEGILHLEDSVAGTLNMYINNTNVSQSAALRIGTGSTSLPIDSGVSLFFSQPTNTFSIINNGAVSSRIALSTRAADGSASEGIYIDEDGNVGIGTTSPEAILDVAGTDAILFPRGDGTNRPSVPVNGMMRYNTVAGRFEAYQGGSWLDILTSGASNIDWDAIVDNMTLDADTDVTMGGFDLSFNNGLALFIDGANDRVGIGTTAPASRLDVARAGSSDTTTTLTIGGAKQSAGADFARIDFVNYDGNGAATDYVAARISSENESGAEYGDLRFSTGTTTLASAPRMIIDAIGNVGIGTVAPDYRLDVASTLDTASDGNKWIATFDVGGTTSGDPQIVLGYSVASASVDAAKILSANSVPLTLGTTGANSAVYIANNGDVGIGTVAPGGQLHVVQGTPQTLTGTSFGAAIFERAAAAANANVIPIVSGNLGNAGVAFGDPDDIDIGRIQYDHSVDALGIFTNNQRQVTIDSVGNVGLGTAAPGAALEVAGTDAILFPRGTVAERPSVPVNGMMRYNSDNNNFDVYQNGGWTTITTAGADTIDWDDIADAMTLDADTDVTMSSFDLSFNNGSALFIDGANDRVGIGTSAPELKFNIEEADTAGLLIEETTETAGDTAALYLKSATADSGFMKGALIYENSGAGWGRGTLHLALDDNDDATNANVADAKLTILDNGNVGIGVTDPAAKLEISNGDLLIDDGVSNQTTLLEEGALQFSRDSDGNMASRIYVDSGIENRQRITLTGREGVDLQYNNSSRLLVSNLGVGIGGVLPDVALDISGNVEYTGTITDVSDRRLKTDIVALPADEMIARIAKIDTYSFTMKDSEDGATEFGVMAQELEAVFPELVRTADDEMGTKSVNYVGLIAPMISATQALKAENDDLRAQVSDMHARVDALAARLEVLSTQERVDVGGAGISADAVLDVQISMLIAMIIGMMVAGFAAGAIIIMIRKSDG